MYRFEGTTNAWGLEREYPSDAEQPDHVAEANGRIVGAAGSDVWILDGDFLALPAAPIEQVDVVGWIGTDVVVWGYDARAAAIYDTTDGSWRRSNAPSIVETREGSSVCVTATELIVWGGWINRDQRRIATNTGVALVPGIATGADR
jgi:hypothetical protein